MNIRICISSTKRIKLFWKYRDIYDWVGTFELQGTDVGHTTVARAFIWTAHGTYSNAVVCWGQSGARRW